MKPDIIRYEENAEQRTVTGWCCKTCNRFWGDSEHMARYCCCTQKDCECGAPTDKFYIRCKSCQSKLDLSKWLSRPEIEWDGEWPIGDWNTDRYFFSRDDLDDYLLDYDLEDENDDETVLLRSIDDMRLTTCRLVGPRHIDISEYAFSDMGPEIDDFPCSKEIDEVANKWISDNSPKVYEMTGERLSIQSVKERLAAQ